MADDPKAVKLGLKYEVNVRKPFPDINKFRDFVTSELERRQALNFSEPSSPFIKMTSCLEVKTPQGPSNFLTLGLHGYKGTEDIFNTIYGAKDVIGYTYNGANQKTVYANYPGVVSVGTHPAPGIISATVSKAKLGAPFKTTIQWKCYNLAQLESLTPYFLTAGIYVVVEWGQKFASSATGKYLDFGSPTISSDIAEFVDLGREKMLQDFVNPSSGNYDFVAGQIADFNIEIDTDQGFNCSTVIYSVGEAMYGIRMTESFADLNQVDMAATIQRFFRPGGGLELMINSNPISKLKNSTKPFNSSNLEQDAAHKIGDSITFAAEDGVYISWSFFVNSVIPRMTNFNRVEPSAEIKFPLNHTVAGDAYALRSIDASVLVIINNNKITDLDQPGETIAPDLAEVHQTESRPKQVNSDAEKDYNGVFESGIWINVHALAEAFLTTQEFDEGLRKLLGMMSNATSNFWNLNLFFDDHTQTFYIVDTNFTPIPEDRKFYKFNSKSKSELFSLTFAASLTSEQKAQAFLTSYKADDAEKDTKRVAILNNTVTRLFQSAIGELTDPISSELKRRGRKFEADQVVAPPLYVQIAELEDKKRALEYLINLPPTATLNGQRIYAQPLDLTVSPVKDPFELSPIKGGNFKDVRKGGEIHEGIDILKPAGYPVVAVSDGKVEWAGPNKDFPARGVYVQIAHSHGRITRYMHLQQAVEVREKETVVAGKLIGRVGNTGHVSGPNGGYHLHFSVLKDDIPENPTIFLGAGLQGNTAYEIGNYINKTASADVAQREYKDELEKINKESEKLRAQNDELRSNSTNLVSILRQPELDSAGIARHRQATEDEIQFKREREAFAGREKQEIARIKQLLNDHYGDDIGKYIETNPSIMKQQIAKEALDNPTKASGLSRPVMTQLEMGLVLKGISGLSPGDAFHVDKIPKIYEESGVFQITGLEDNISIEAGWTTRITALFKILPKVK